jgi:DNA-directed RNA polymerase sigma subunit (sigma70/sigma32)
MIGRYWRGMEGVRARSEPDADPDPGLLNVAMQKGNNDLPEEIRISASTVSNLRTASIRPASLRAPMSDEDSTELGETVGDEDAQTPFELLRDKDLREEVRGLAAFRQLRARRNFVSVAVEPWKT